MAIKKNTEIKIHVALDENNNKLSPNVETHNLLHNVFDIHTCKF